MDLSDRILCKELLGKYPPHFQYQMIRLYDYSNEELLNKGDEISLAMLINKITNSEDIEAFSNLPDEQMNEILKDTPEYLLNIMEKLARALFYSLHMPGDKTEKVVSKIKERKMGRLFENVTFDYQAEMEYMRNKMREMDERCKQMKEQSERMEEEYRKKLEKNIEEQIKKMKEEKEKELEEQIKRMEKENKKRL